MTRSSSATHDLSDAVSMTVEAIDRMISSVESDIANEDPGNHATIGALRGEETGLRNARTYLVAAIERASVASESEAPFVADYQRKIERDAATMKVLRLLLREAYDFLNAQAIVQEDYEDWEKRYKAFAESLDRLAGGVAFVMGPDAQSTPSAGEAPSMDRAVRDAYRSALTYAASICDAKVFDRENAFDNGCWSCGEAIRQELNAINRDNPGELPRSSVGVAYPEEYTQQADELDYLSERDGVSQRAKNAMRAAANLLRGIPSATRLTTEQPGRKCGKCCFNCVGDEIEECRRMNPERWNSPDSRRDGHG